MSFLRASMPLMFVAAGLFASAIALGQSRGQSAGPDKILDIVATHTTSEGEQTYVYLRVFSDGLAECESNHAGRSASKKHLPNDEYIKIKSILDEPKLAKLRPRYETRYGIIDTSTEWKIEVHRVGKTQFIEVLEFSPGLAKLMKHPYPNALVQLGCNAERLRADILGESALFDRECRKTLGLRDGPESR